MPGAIGSSRVPASPPPSENDADPEAERSSTIRVDLIEHLGSDAFIDVTDESFTLLQAISGDPGYGVDVQPDEIRVENDPDEPATIVLTWSGSPCDTSHALVIGAEGRTLSMTRPACSGDSLGGVGHVLRLTFDAPAAAADFAATLETTP